MKSSTRLEYAVFQLTPTRTRFDLMIVANGKTEKIASGLINPFLAHLKSARDQFAKGGYSIVLKPESGTDSESWFTKDTVERFVLFVNTPVVLERVHILESEIIQIEKAITTQTQNDIHSSKVEIVHFKPAESTHVFMEEDKGLRPIPNANDEKAIVLYEPSNLADEETTVYSSEENSKVQLVKVLETRKSFLQKEQKMAFARALASGFDIDQMAPLVSFAECFTASRFMDACARFVKIWKSKNDIVQWLKTEGADSSSPLDYPPMATAGIVLSGVAGNELNPVGPLSESAVEPGPNNSSSHQFPAGSQNHVHGQFAPPMYPPWGLISPSGLPVFQGYPVQGMPFYPNYQGHGPFIYPPYQSPDDVESGSHEKKIQRRHSLETNGINKSDSRGMTDEEITSLNNSDLGEEAPDSKGSHRKTRSSKQKSRNVVIRNINYITAKRQNDFESQSPSDTDNDSDKDVEDASVTKSTTRQRRCTIAVDLESSINEQLGEKASSAGHWHAFQNCLMRSSNDRGGIDNTFSSMEKRAKTKPQLTGLDKDPLADGAHHQSQHGASVYLNPSVYSHGIQKASHDELLRTNIGNHDNQDKYEDAFDAQVAEINGSVIRHRSANDNFMVQRQLAQSNYTMSPADMSSVNISANDGSQKVTDDSFILPSRPTVRHEGQNSKIDGIDMDYDLPSSHPDTKDYKRIRQATYEPEDLGWIADRGTLQDSVASNGVIDYEMEVTINRNVQGNSKNYSGSNKKDKNQKSKISSGTLDIQRSVRQIKGGKLSKMSPIEEARARAEKLRSLKADLQKQKKEKEEEQKKRIEALKVERQKRIFARSNVAPTKSVQPSPPTRKQLLEKASPGKFSDLEPGFTSPLQGVSRRTLSLGAIESRKAPKPKSNTVTPSSVNKVNKSVSLLSELKKGEGIVTPEIKASMSRIRRLSEPRKGNSNVSPSRRYNGTSIVKENTSSGPESKKVSGIVNVNKTKASTVPDLKMRMPQADTDVKNDDVYPDKSTIKQMTTSGNQPNPVHIPFDSEAGNNMVVIQQSAGYATSVVEKTTATLEHENSNVTQVTNKGNLLNSAHTPENAEVENNKVVVQKCAGDATLAVENNIATPVYEKHSGIDEHKVKEVTELQECNHQSERVMTAVTNVNGEPRANKSKVQFDAHEVTKSGVEKDLPKFTVVEAKEPYQPPCARVSSLEEHCTGNSEYGKATPVFSNKEASLSVAATPQLKLESVPEASEKPWLKESSKGGFKRLLKFGKKSVLSSGDHNSEIDSINRAGSEGHQCATNGTSSSQAPTLKNLISNDETEIASTPPPKSSRHFSLLSPFRKSSEKKIIIL